MNYYDYQKAVFDHLWARYQKDDNFRFSVRRKAMKGAEKNYFIGTENSGYFGFTFWDTPVYYPGSAADLTDYIFRGSGEDLHFLFQFGTSKSATGEQNEGDLELGYELIRELDAAGVKYVKSPDHNKMLFFTIDFNPQGYSSIDELLKGLDESYNALSPIMDRAIETIKARRPNWLGGRFEKEKFLRLIDKMHERIQEYSSGRKDLTANESHIEYLSAEEPQIQDFNKHPLNKILYGPPGTGKTYHTIDKALQIVDFPFYEQNKNNRTALTERFKSLLIKDWTETTGQIAFVTFHQSMTYEDFIEGIKPIMRTEIANDIKYEVADGIFKKLCIEASRTRKVKATIDGDITSLTKEMFEDLYYTFSQELPDHSAESSNVQLKTKEGYPFDLFRNSVDSIVVKAGEKRVGQNVSFNELWAVINENKPPTYKSYEQIIIDKILEGKTFETTKIENQLKKFVLIIDEINRGNVSNIFGELITLIEEGKRDGQAEELAITLPYSKKVFSVPSNLHIIGTMNTADRSVEALDTALRRRFAFEEMVPQPQLLNSKQMLCRYWNRPENINVDDEWYEEPFITQSTKFYELIGLTREQENRIINQPFEKKDIERREWRVNDLDILADLDFTGVSLQNLLSVINSRLEILLSKDHKIGHAFFLQVFSVEDLYNIFFQKVIPQLQEYFYGDFGKIGLVIGRDFVKLSDPVEKVNFASFDYDDMQSLLEKPIYRIDNFDRNGSVDYDKFLSAVKNVYK